MFFEHLRTTILVTKCIEVIYSLVIMINLLISINMTDNNCYFEETVQTNHPVVISRDVARVEINVGSTPKQSYMYLQKYTFF